MRGRQRAGPGGKLPGMSTSPVPAGYHSLQAYLIVPDAPRALALYAELFGATEVLRLPQPGTGKLMHVELQLGDSRLMLADEFPEWNIHAPAKYGGTPVSLLHYVPDVDAVFARAQALGCQVLFPPTDQFWGDRHCKFVDPFGHVWGVATHLFDPTPEQLAAGAQQYGS
jgi:PhnB protein